MCNDPSRKVGVGSPQSPVTHEVFHPKWKTGSFWLRCVAAVEHSTSSLEENAAPGSSWLVMWLPVNLSHSWVEEYNGE